MHATLAFAALPLFLGALLSDWAYAQSYEVQWTNFASWLNAGGLLLAGPALLWGLVDHLRARAARHGRGWVALLLLLLGVVVGFINALVHARDGWAAMPSGLILSVAVVLLVALASVMGLQRLQRRTA
ncbi:DUF2231 domain-containing protein [Aquabacterium sp. J223]|uniref:DUF2231 domain-containing protein n=1 Tax=Aquabacterium sp. J223 TaxID=2898431 RepID=UPI0021ADC605|nr:DUF2231 domain-containing protein [Aquabacterium sp. J223]UUX95255.1 hypothetical protein LRS07_18830 [Aquabacterium sp. J223]